MPVHYSLQLQYYHVFMTMFAIACQDIVDHDIHLKLIIPTPTNKTVLEIRIDGIVPRVVIVDFDNVEEFGRATIEYYPTVKAAEAWLSGDYERSEEDRIVRSYGLDYVKLNLNSMETIMGRIVTPIVRFLKTGAPFATD